MNTDTTQPEVKLDPEKIAEEERAAEKHAEKNTVKADPQREICVDGGTRKRENRGAIARPGGDAGLALGLIGMGFAPQEAYDLTLAFVTEKLGRKFGFHTDTHAQDAHQDDGHGHAHDGAACIGCGHMFRPTLANQAELYGVDPQAAFELVTLVQGTPAEQSDRLVLHRKHKERAVLVIKGLELTVNAWDNDDSLSPEAEAEDEAGDQYFIYNADHDAALLSQFVAHIKETKPDFDEAAYLASVGKQTEATLGLLAGNLPMITIEYVEKDGQLKPKATHAGYITELKPKEMAA